MTSLRKELEMSKPLIDFFMKLRENALSEGGRVIKGQHILNVLEKRKRDVRHPRASGV